MSDKHLPKPSQRVYRLTRDLHLYLGLLVSPVLVIFACSVIFLNHAFLPWTGDDTQTSQVRLSLPETDNSLELAKTVRAQISMPGEIEFIQYRPNEGVLSFPIRRPGATALVSVDLSSNVATVETTRSGVWDAMLYMHMMPGPHNASVRGNWLMMRVWSVLSDATVYLLLLVTATGVYLWLILKAERKMGLIFLGSGVVSFIVIVLMVVA